MDSRMDRVKDGTAHRSRGGDINDRIGRRLHDLRLAQGYTLDALAARSGVSRSNISLIERGRSSPTATVLDRLAGALGVALASLFEGAAPRQAPPSPLSRTAEQPVWTDPQSGYVRRQLSPDVELPFVLIEVRFPAGRRVSYDGAMRGAERRQQVWMIEGTMEIAVGDERWRIEAGDCLAMRLDRPVVFRNPTRKPARYLVALAAPMPPRRNP